MNSSQLTTFIAFSKEKSHTTSFLHCSICFFSYLEITGIIWSNKAQIFHTSFGGDEISDNKSNEESYKKSNQIILLSFIVAILTGLILISDIHKVFLVPLMLSFLLFYIYHLEEDDESDEESYEISDAKSSERSHGIICLNFIIGTLLGLILNSDIHEVFLLPLILSFFLLHVFTAD